MIKRIFLALALILFSQPAFADTWTVGQQSLSFSPAGTNVVGDGTTTQGGIAPVYENGSNPFEAADIADNFTTSTYLTTSVSRNTATPSEAKMRTVCNFGFTGTFDPIVFPGTAVAGHLHMFSGNLAAAYNSTYSQLRQNGESTCAGNKINRTAYWAPAMEEVLSTGYTAVRKFSTQIVYYTVNPLADNVFMTRFPRNFRYIGGYDPSDPNNTKLTVPITAANTPGCVGGACRYSVASGGGNGTSSGTGFLGWTCLDTDHATPVNGSNANSPVAGNSTQPYLRTAAGLTTLTCPTNGGLMAEVHAPPCWDGKNLASGGSTGGGVGGINLPSSSGRLHVSYKVQDGNTGKQVCPTGWWQFPEFLAKYIWYLSGTEDVGKFFLSSDVMNYGAPDATSRSPCRQVSSNYCRGETFHFDWWGAWSYGSASAPGPMIKWMVHCNGIKFIDSTGTINADPAECDTSTIDGTNALQISGTTSGGLAFGNPGVSYSGAAKWDTVVPGSTGNAHLHHGIPPGMSMNDNLQIPANDELAGAAPVSFDLGRFGGR